MFRFSFLLGVDAEKTDGQPRFVDQWRLITPKSIDNYMQTIQSRNISRNSAAATDLLRKRRKKARKKLTNKGCKEKERKGGMEEEKEAIAQPFAEVSALAMLNPIVFLETPLFGTSQPSGVHASFIHGANYEFSQKKHWNGFYCEVLSGEEENA
eukprot:Gb_02745 [translate_table: standard]